MKTVARIAGLVFALVVMVVGFHWWDDQADYVMGWLGACLVSFILSFLLPPP